MFSALISTLLFAQIGGLAPLLPNTLEDDRLRACLNEARSDPATSIATASQWLEGTGGVERSAPQQCLGFAYMGLLRWDAAREAFIAARDARSDEDRAARARLGGMAGNAALAGQRNDEALALLQQAQDDASAAGQGDLAGAIAADRARAHVAIGSDIDGAQALAQARELAPQSSSVWLLSATLARRMNDLVSAQNWIETAALLDAGNPEIGLEAGLIAALGGFDDAARSSWQSVIDTAGNSPQATTARSYLQQLEEPQVDEETAPQ